MKTIKGCLAGLGVPTKEEEKKLEPMTLEELRKRLKQIAGLCWGLSIDIANELELNKKCNQLRSENINLQKEIKRLSSKLYHSEYNRERRKDCEN